MMKPTQKVLAAVASGRTVVGPVNVGRAVRMWRAYSVPAHLTPNGAKQWEISLQNTDGENVAGTWVYTVPTTGASMLWELDY